MRRVETRRFEINSRASRFDHRVHPRSLAEWHDFVASIFAQDCRFAFRTVICLSAHVFDDEATDALMMSFFFPQRPMDNMEWSPSSPQEDEFALV
jgi:hypothetical protein